MSPIQPQVAVGQFFQNGVVALRGFATAFVGLFSQVLQTLFMELHTAAVGLTTVAPALAPFLVESGAAWFSVDVPQPCCTYNRRGMAATAMLYMQCSAVPQADFQPAFDLSWLGQDWDEFHAMVQANESEVGHRHATCVRVWLCE